MTKARNGKPTTIDARGVSSAARKPLATVAGGNRHLHIHNRGSVAVDDRPVCGKQAAVPHDVIAQTDFFTSLNEEQLVQIARLCRPQSFAKGTPVYRLGEPTDGFYVLVDGIVRFSLGLDRTHASAGEIIRCGDVFGWAALIDGAPARLATAHCITDCNVLTMNGSQLLQLMEADNVMGYRLMKRLNALISGNLNHFVAG